MQDYFVYHNPNVMPPITEFPRFLALTNNKVADVQHGSRVWVVTGEGKPRTFLLHGYFFVDETGLGSHGFKSKLFGTTGKEFKSMNRLNDLEWFADFSCQHPLRFGFQAITETRFIKGLEAVAAGAE